MSQIKNKKSILNIHIDQILVGDLIYDSYLTRNNQQKATIDFTNPDFISFLYDFILLFFAWKNIFKKNNINVIITSHSIYTMGIPVRLALKKKAIALEVKEDKIKRLNNTNLTQFFETKNYPKIFKKFKTIEKKVFIKKAEKKLKLRFEGSNEDLPYVTKSAFQKNFKSKKIKIKKNKKKKIKVLILSHDFIDAPHCAGNFLFSDMYEWIKYLAKKSKEKNYQWFLKTHPNMGGKYKWYQDFTRNNIKKLISGSDIKFLNPNTPHNQILQYGVDFVLTVFGTAGHEYAYKNIKVINASNNNPHSAYKFNIHTNSIKTYDNYLNNLTNVKLNINKKDVLEYYSMHYLYNSRNWFFKDYNHLVKTVGYHGQWTVKVYKYWIENYRNDFKENFFNKFDFFIKSKDSVFSVKHENKD